MEDRSNIIKEAIEYRDKLEKEVVRLRTIISKIKKIAENACRDDCPDLKNGYCIGLGECAFRARKQILDLITKAESEG